MLIAYGVIIRIYFGLIALVSLFHWKAKLFFRYRRNWEPQLKSELSFSRKKFLLISPSIGEFQECRKFVSRITSERNDCQFIYAFFSPSGFDQAKIMGEKPVRMMLPMDSKKNAKKLLDIINPDQVFILSTGIWPCYIREIRRREIPLFLISFYSKKDSGFFRPLPFVREFYKPLFQSFSRIFCYPEEGKKLLQEYFGCKNVENIGNLRFDCVIDMKKNLRSIRGIDTFVGNRFCFVAGSTESGENSILIKTFSLLRHLDIKWIIVPHEKRPNTLKKLERNFGDYACFYTNGFDPNKRVLIYDITGDLFHLYQYAQLALVGRGFHPHQIHNMLEPAVFLKPVLIGPMHKRFIEPKFFIKNKLAFEFKNEKGLASLIEKFYTKELTIDKNAIQKIFDEGSNGTEIVMNYLKNFHYT